METPIPITASERIAKVCWRHTSSMKTTVNARNPGTSRRPWSIPISLPVNPAFSTTKLLISTDQVSNAMGMEAANSSSSICGLRQPSFSTPDQSSSRPRRRLTFSGLGMGGRMARRAVIARE